MKHCWFWPIFLPLTVLPVEARVLYVKSNVPQSQDRQTWQRSFDSIGKAVQASQPGDRIWVAEGTYSETAWASAGIQIYGGFSGNERSLDERDWTIHPTILRCAGPQAISGPFELDGFILQGHDALALQASGQGIQFRNCIFRENYGTRAGAVECVAGSTVSFVSCVFENNTSQGASAVLLNNATGIFERCDFRNNGNEGPSKPSFSTITAYRGTQITIKQCRFNQNRGSHSGGILCMEGSSLQCNESKFQQNTSQKTGGAISIVNGQSTLDRCLFQLNDAHISGGAMTATNSSVHIRSSTFSWNRTNPEDSVGGALFLYQGASELTDCLISHNSANKGGGLSTIEQEQTRLIRCRILGNASITHSGGMQCELTKSLSLDDCTLQNNFCIDTGGGMYASNTPAIQLNKCRLENNRVTSASTFGAGVSLENTLQVEIVACTFRNNTLHRWATLGAGLYVSNGAVFAFKTLFQDNSSLMGAGMAARDQSKLTVRNCTLINTTRTPQNAVNLPRDKQTDTQTKVSWINNAVLGYRVPFYPPIKNMPQSNVTLPTPDIRSQDWLTANEMRMIDPEHGDFRLRPDSPLIDAGEGTDTIEGFSPYDGNGDGKAMWDIGAFEYRGNAPN